MQSAIDALDKEILAFLKKIDDSAKLQTSLLEKLKKCYEEA